MQVDGKVTLLFAFFGAAIGLVCGVIGGNVNPRLCGLLALVFFYISYRLVPRILDLEETSFDPTAWNMLKTGAIPYWFIWLVFWTMIYTLRF